MHASQQAKHPFSEQEGALAAGDRNILVARIPHIYATVEILINTRSFKALHIPISKAIVGALGQSRPFRM